MAVDLELIFDIWLMMVALGPSVVALLVERYSGHARLVERHHSRHDTYAVPPQFTHAIAKGMLVASTMGIVLATMCMSKIFSASATLVLVFFDAFVLTAWLMWLGLCRFKVSLFQDRNGSGAGGEIVVTPFVGREICIVYNDIFSMRWTGIRRASGYRDLRITTFNGKSATIWAVVDIEQILLHIDRFDALAPAGI